MESMQLEEPEEPLLPPQQRHTLAAAAVNNLKHTQAGLDRMSVVIVLVI